MWRENFHGEGCFGKDIRRILTFLEMQFSLILMEARKLLQMNITIHPAPFLS